MGPRDEAVDASQGVLTGLYDGYLVAAGTADPDERLARLRLVVTEDFEILSPLPYRVSGVAEVAHKLGEVAAGMPGGTLRLVRTSELDAHHDVFRVLYASVDADGRVESTGMHVAEVADGRLARLMVFLPGPVPSAASRLDEGSVAY